MLQNTKSSKYVLDNIFRFRARKRHGRKNRSKFSCNTSVDRKSITDCTFEWSVFEFNDNFAIKLKKKPTKYIAKISKSHDWLPWGQFFTYRRRLRCSQREVFVTDVGR